MGNETPTILAFNRGRISPKALARVDIQRMAFSADVQTNLPPRVLGSMTLRPGLEYLFSSAGDAAAQYIDFVYSATDTALLEVTASGIRVSVSDAIITRAAVETSIGNGTFDSDLTSWTDADEGTAASAWLTGGYLELVGTLYDAAIRRQEVTVTDGDKSIEHGVTFTIERGPVSVKVGSTSGGDEYVAEKELNTGTYSFVFTPTANFHIELAGRAQAKSLVNSVSVDAEGDFTLPVDWTASDLDNLRWDQSLDVLFIACKGFQQRRLERFDTTSKSWGISLYAPVDGPFRGINFASTTLTPSALAGDITLTASRALFSSAHVGALFKVTSVGQTVTSALTAENQFTDDIRVVGVGNSRAFTLTITGTWTATVTLQRSIDETGSWVDVGTYTTNQASISYDDGLDNQIAYYRIGIKTGGYTSGTATCTLQYASGGIIGVARVTGYTSSTVVAAAVLEPMGATTSSVDWHEGSWSNHRGYPSAVAFYEGRLWWFGKGFNHGSVSDGFTSFDDEVEGDSGPINRSISARSVDTINWVLPLQRLLIGTTGAEVSARSTSFDEPLTPTLFNQKDASTQGSALIDAVKIDANGIFVQRGGTRVFEVEFDFNSNDYKPTDLTDIVPEIGEPSIVQIVVQRQPDTRIHCIRSDGTVGMLIREPGNEVLCWLDVETDGLVERAVVLPGTIEDAVYYLVNRTINGATKRYLEKWAVESECVGGTLNKQADSFLEFTNSPASATVTGLSHLEGKSVVVWGDGLCLKDSDGDIATFTVTSGSITLTNDGSSYPATTGIVGLAYQGRFESTKLAYASQMGSALTQRKRMSHLGLILHNTHAQGIKYGPSFTVMDDLPLIDNEGAEVDTDSIHSEYDMDMFEWPGGWGTDERMCLEMNAPRPCTVLGVVMGLQETDKV